VDYWTPYSWEYNEDNIFQAENEFDEMRKNYQNIVKIKATSVRASEMFSDNHLDLVYIDADHAEAPFREDMTVWIPKVKPGGIISGHDFGFVGDYIKDFSENQEVKVFEDGTWFYFKK
jgi:predicted O-methyltransferase YrrM